MICRECQQPVDALTSLGSCTPCSRAYWNRTAKQRRVSPPKGWLSVPMLARRLHYTYAAVQRWLRLGWMADQRWRRTPGGSWYVPDLPAYPPPPSKRRKVNR